MEDLRMRTFEGFFELAFELRNGVEDSGGAQGKGVEFINPGVVLAYGPVQGLFSELEAGGLEERGGR
jgi:hypothetical protein